MHSFFEWLCSLPEIPFCTVVSVVFVLLFLLLLTPILAFLRYGWLNRHNDILNSFTEETARYYAECFHRFEAPDTFGTTAADSALAWFERYYREQFGRQKFIVGLLLFLALTACGLYMIAVTVVQWQAAADINAGMLPLAVALALLGGFTWVLFDLIARAARDDISPNDLYWWSFRILISAPVGYAFGKVFTADLALPMAYLLGALPTGTIMGAASRVAAKWVQLPDAAPQSATALQKLASVDTYLAEQFGVEGITNAEKLAYADPVRLAIRTGLNFSVVLCCTGEALLGTYWREPKQLAAARKYGLSGAYECRQLWEDLNSAEAAVQARANTIVDSLAGEADLGTPRPGVINVLTEVAEDPYTLFQRECWAATMREW